MPGGEETDKACGKMIWKDERKVSSTTIKVEEETFFNESGMGVCPVTYYNEQQNNSWHWLRRPLLK